MATRMLDITPTWKAILPALLLALENGNAEGRRIAREELTRMAEGADLWNSSQKAEK